MKSTEAYRVFLRHEFKVMLCCDVDIELKMQCLFKQMIRMKQLTSEYCKIEVIL